MGVNTNTKIKVAFIGAGSMAQEHIKAFASFDGVELAGIHSRTTEKAQKMAQTFSVMNVCSSIDQLWTTTKADLVVVTVFEVAMLEVALEVMKYPWKVLLEKPAGYNFEQAEKIAKCTRDNKRSVFVGLNRRFLASTEAAVKSLQEKNEKRFIHVQDQQSLETAKIIGHPDVVVKNWMYANSIHLVDYLTLLGRGEVTKVTNMQKWEGEKTSLMLSHIEFSSGDVGVYQGIWQGPGPWAVLVNTPSERWELRPLEVASIQKAGERKLATVELANKQDQEFKPGFWRQTEEVLKAVRGESSLAPTIADSLKSMKLVSQIFAVN